MCEVTQVAPIHLAIMAGNLETIQELLVCGAVLDLADHSGNNVFHYAAKSDSPKVIQVKCMKSHVKFFACIFKPLSTTIL